MLTIRGRKLLSLAGHCSWARTSVLRCTCSFQEMQVAEGPYWPCRGPAGCRNSWALEGDVEGEV